MTVYFGDSSRFPAGATLWQPPPEPVADDFIRDVKVTAEAFSAAQEAQRFANNAYSDLAAGEEAVDRRNDAIKAATGIALDNPYRALFTPEELRRKAEALGYHPSADGEVIRRRILDERAGAYEQRLRELAEQSAGDEAALAAIRPDVSVADDARALGAAAERRSAEAMATPSSRPWLKWGASFAGSFAGWIRDPYNIAQILAGSGGGAAATTTIGAVVRGGLRELVVNAAGETLAQPAVQKWRAELGLEAGLGPALENVGMAAAFGGILGGAGAGVAHALRKPGAPPVIARALGGDDEAIMAAARESGDEALVAGADAMAADNLARGPAPAWADRQRHGADFAQAVRFAENPASGAPPEVTVWHGSPHAFDAFSAERLGTGEGTQIMGRGLYFAEERSVGQWYADTLAKPAFELPDGTRLPFPEERVAGLPPDTRAYLGQVIRENQGDPKLKDIVLGRLHQARKGFTDEAQAGMRALAQFIDELPPGTRMTTEQHLYEARITRPAADFLDLDASLSAQAPQVQTALRVLGVEDMGLSGRAALDALGDDKAAAAETLRSQGLAGLRYRDALSRDLKAKTSNFVVFDPADVRAVARNGEPLGATGGKAAAPVPAAEPSAPSKPRGVLDAYPVADDATGGARLLTSDALKAAPARDGELATIVRACNTV